MPRLSLKAPRHVLGPYDIIAILHLFHIMQHFSVMSVLLKIEYYELACTFTAQKCLYSSKRLSEVLLDLIEINAIQEGSFQQNRASKEKLVKIHSHS